jgi:2-dehydropantoate 2-reductase
MKVLMVGRGVISTIYGWAFSKAGHDVSFLVRPGRAAELGGSVRLDLVDVRADRRGSEIDEVLDAACIESLGRLGEFDLAVLGVRQEQMRSGAEQLAAAPRPRLGVLFFNNYWEEPRSLSSLFEPGGSLWAFPRAGGAYEGRRGLKGAVLGEIECEADGGASEGLRLGVERLFASASIRISRRTDFRAWLWLHFAINAAVIAQAIHGGEGIEGLLASGPRLSDAARLSREAVKVVYARGVDPSSARDEAAIAHMLPFLAGRFMKAMAARDPAMRRMMGAGPDSGRLALIPLAVLSEARRLGVPCPGLESIGPELEAVAGAR